MYEGSNWFARKSGPDATLWKRDLALLVATHEALRAAVEALTPAELRRVTPGAKNTNLTMITGIAAHDLYHTGRFSCSRSSCAGEPLSGNPNEV